MSKKLCGSAARFFWICHMRLYSRPWSLVYERRFFVSKLIESLRDDMASLAKCGAIGQTTLRQFDAMCAPPVRVFTAPEIKKLRRTLRFSQPVFALHLNTTASTVRKWEQGITRPTGPALKLLNIVANKGVQVLL